MTSLVIVSELLYERKDSLSIISFAYVLSLLINPMSLFSVGFLLSFGAVFSIISITPLIQKQFKRLPKQIAGFVAISIAATIGTAPIVINYFSHFSIIGIVANLLIIPIASISVILVMLSTFMGQTVGVYFAFVGDKLIILMDKIMDVLLKIPFASIEVKRLPDAFIYLWFAVIFVISDYCLLKKKSKKIIVSIVIVIMLVLLIIPLFEKSNYEVYFFDINQGDAALIKTPNNKIYMVDCGRSYNYRNIESYLKSNNYKLDAIFLSHSDTDHCGAIEYLKDNDMVDKVYVSMQDKENYENNDGYITLVAGDIIDLDGEIEVEIIYPDSSVKDKDTNDLSIVMDVKFLDYRILFTGDMSSKTEKEIIDRLSDVDILKVAHHGSKNSTSKEFLEKIDAEYAVIMVGENGYGHPSGETLFNLSEYCDIIFRTDYDGGVHFIFDDKITVSTVIDHENYEEFN